MSEISERLTAVQRQIAEACTACGRDPASVRLLAVSKTKPVTDVRAAMDAGQQAFGENYLQEACDKIRALTDAEWHFIGAIQSNKTRDIAQYFDWVHSVASARVGQRLSSQRPTGRAPLNVLIQVNISEEAQKSGVAPEETLALAGNLLDYGNIRLRGLMAIPAAQDDPAEMRKAFARLRELRDDIATRLGLVDFDQLSMGMSGDFALAIAEGATWIRIGTAIFGARSN